VSSSDDTVTQEIRPHVQRPFSADFDRFVEESVPHPRRTLSLVLVDCGGAIQENTRHLQHETRQTDGLHESLVHQPVFLGPRARR